MKVKIQLLDEFDMPFAEAESIEFPFVSLIDSDQTNPTRRYAIDAIEGTMTQILQEAITRATLEPKPEKPQHNIPVDTEINLVQNYKQDDIFGME